MLQSFRGKPVSLPETTRISDLNPVVRLSRLPAGLLVVHPPLSQPFKDFLFVSRAQAEGTRPSKWNPQTGILAGICLGRGGCKLTAAMV